MLSLSQHTRAFINVSLYWNITNAVEEQPLIEISPQPIYLNSISKVNVNISILYLTNYKVNVTVKNCVGHQSAIKNFSKFVFINICSLFILEYKISQLHACSKG